MLYFVGTGTPTLSRIQWAGKDLKEESRWLYDHDAQTEAFPEKKPISLVEDGDGTVPTLSATPTAALLKRLPGRVIVGKAAHREMFEHEEFLREAEAFLKQHLAKP